MLLSAYNTSLAYQFDGWRESSFCSCLSYNLNYCFFHGTFLLERMANFGYLDLSMYLVAIFLVKVLVAQSCLTLGDSVDYGSPGSSVHGIL